MNLSALQNRYLRHRTAAAIAAIAVATPLALLVRRPDQWTAPAVWIEEGTIALPDFVAHGWSSLLHPMMGYLVLPTKILLALSAAISFRWLPEIEFALTILFTAGVLVAVALSPTELKARLACALALLALPCDSEVYGTSAYAFWWGSLLAILPLLWREGAGRHLLRSGLLALGGLSSPLILALSPMYFVRALVRRTGSAFSDFAIAAVAATIQYWFVRQTAQTGNTSFQSIRPGVFVQKFFGFYVDIPVPFGAHEVPTLLAGIAVLAALAYCSWQYRRHLGLAYFLLCGAFVLAAVASVSRVPIAAIHPSLAGPRYFFFPFTLLTWIVVQVGTLPARIGEMVALVIFALAGRNALDVAQRRHDPLDWRANLAQCLAEDRHEMPIHWDGHAATAWKTSMAGADCRRMVAGSLVDNAVAEGPRP